MSDLEGDFLISAACIDHQRIFDSPEELTWLSQEILQALLEAKLLCLAWVFLPNHYHVLLRLTSTREVSEILRRRHSLISTKINIRQQHKGRQVWYRFSDRNIRSERHYWTTMNYIHFNPVKHNYVDSMVAWPWSSVHEYLDKFGEEYLRQIWGLYPVQNYGKSWD